MFIEVTVLSSCMSLPDEALVEVSETPIASLCKEYKKKPCTLALVRQFGRADHFRTSLIKCRFLCGQLFSVFIAIL